MDASHFALIRQLTALPDICPTGLVFVVTAELVGLLCLFYRQQRESI